MSMVIETPIGEIDVEKVGGKVVRVEFVSERKSSGEPDEFVALLEGKVKCVVGGSEFQRLVWKEISGVKRGGTISYSQIAQNIGRPKAYRAVANACGANLLPILIPCHRVVAANGGLGGYSSGIWRKKWLLECEGVDLSRFK